MIRQNRWLFKVRKLFYLSRITLYTTRNVVCYNIVRNDFFYLRIIKDDSHFLGNLAKGNAMYLIFIAAYYYKYKISKKNIYVLKCLAKTIFALNRDSVKVFKHSSNVF